MSEPAWRHCEAVLQPVLALAPADYTADVRDRLEAYGIQDAVARHDSGAIVGWVLTLVDRQGISNLAAIRFAERNGAVSWNDIAAMTAPTPACPKLRSFWDFDDCGYRKSAKTCSRPGELFGCPVPRVAARKGTLSQAAIGLWLFVRDCCDGDLVAWLDRRLAEADPGRTGPNRATIMRKAVLKPLSSVAGTGTKVWAMTLAELLLAGDPGRERWVTTGASFVAVDSLVHAFLHRTGILRRLDAEHSYGPRCHEPGGCADVITALAERVDARSYNPRYPACFPRFLQFGIWRFCAEGGRDVCNGKRIDNDDRCNQTFCPCHATCDRLADT